MAAMNSDDLIERLDLLQKTVWDIDEKTRHNLLSIAEQQIELSEIRTGLSAIKEKLDRLESEIKTLSGKKEDKNG